MKSEMSPMEAFKIAMKVWALLLLVTFGSCSAGFKLDAPYTEKVATEVTLVQAYSSMQHCGKHDSCEEFKGLFRAADGKTYERSMTGFHYHNFVDGGKKEMLGCYITLTLNDKGVETPGYIKFLMSMGIVFGFLFIVGGICFLFGSIDAEYAQSEWERKQRNERRGW
jgi:hypothetical protein